MINAKFRIFNGEKWEYFSNFQLDFDDSENYFIYMNGGSEFTDLKTLVQFTGILDKKGKEIY